MTVADHLHMYNLRGRCWCGAHRDDWLKDEDMLERIGGAFKALADKARAESSAIPDQEVK